MSKALLIALKTAFNAEKEGIRMYLKFAKDSAVVSGKNMFIQLAADEVDHLEIVQESIDEHMAGKKYEKIKIPKGRLSKFMPDIKDLSLQPVDKADINDEEALKVAVKHELKAKNFYVSEAENTDNEEVKKIFTELADVEEKHYQILQTELDFIRKDGFWFDTMEFSLEAE